VKHEEVASEGSQVKDESSSSSGSSSGSDSEEQSRSNIGLKRDKWLGDSQDAAVKSDDEGDEK